ncbi:MAG: hypothetical protein GX174_14335 [Lentisphaerae bacterium]|jgi:restriction system protein|nr:winged helix-turn-helix domain-containing protein [Kiritimatiellia bacterium]MDD2349747.1 winged helix-turn-helix domain-containing protein [Kiritimatiellia bacterium]NLN03060.1 hypothetical protein [Lentisphaerota bacterium]HHU14053.1 hypothetical protein [Lentisphaerota bacterium]HON93919.1 winged helix-turn-helix domain-containing protein [Sedimentisphaerales bacterium]
MNESNPGNVLSGFEILLEELEAEIEICTRSGARAVENRDFGKAEAAIARAKMVTEFRDKVADLRKQWDAIGGADYDQDEEAKVERQNLGRLRRGLRTSETDFYLPILKALDELGGSAKMQSVLSKVHKAMKPVLKDVDYEPLSSNPDMPRWRNTAQWARNTMRQEGLLKDDSPHGTWEISDAGRLRLAQGKRP